VNNVIILVTKNGSKFILDQLTSISKCKSKYPKIIYWYDDMSTDSTCSLIEDLKNTSIIRVPYNPKNQSISDNFLYTLEMALKELGNNNIYYFCDQDDIWDKTKIMNTEKKAKQKNVLILSNTQCFGSHRMQIKPNLKRYWILNFFFNISPGMSFAFKNDDILSLIQKIKKFEWHDHGLFLHYFSKNYNIIYINNVLQYYRRHDSAVTIKLRKLSFWRLFYGVKNFYLTYMST